MNHSTLRSQNRHNNKLNPTHSSHPIHFIPAENAPEVDGLFPEVDVIPVATIEDAFQKLWGDFV